MSYIYTCYETSQSVESGNTIAFISPSMIKDCSKSFDTCERNDTIIVGRCGKTSKLDFNINFVAGASGTITFSLMKNGVAYPGASAVVTVTSGQNYQVTIQAVIKSAPCKLGYSITLEATGLNITVTSASLSGGTL